MTREQLQKNVGDLVITPEQYVALSDYLGELLRWNKKINMTSITDIDECWEKHIQDSLLVYPFFSGSETVLDVGSGAGLPSIPLSIMLPELDISSVDTVGKKITFQRHCVRTLKLKKFTAISARIENLYEKQGRCYDVIVSRAFASLAKFVELCSPYMNEGGRLIALKGAGYREEICEAESVISRAGLVVDNIVEKQLKPSGAVRAFVVIKKRETYLGE